jgi:hypothetical protein
MADRTPEEDLIFNIGYGLKRAGLKMPIEACRQIGARVLAHLKLAGFEFTRRAPKEAHGSAMPANVGARKPPHT